MAQQLAFPTSRSTENPDKIIRKVAWVVALGVLLNPLNSSMIAVALLQIGNAFQVNLATVTWLLSGFYLAGAVGPSLAGKLSDLFGAKKLFMSGLVLVLISSLLAIWTQNFGLLLTLRIIQALGSAVAFPAGMSMLRSTAARHNEQDHPDRISSALALVSIMANVMAAFGPTLGGILVGSVGWQSIFWINIPIVLATLFIARLWLPKDHARQATSSESGAVVSNIWSRIDIPGITLFMVMLTTLMLFLLSLTKGMSWWLLGCAVVSMLALMIWEKRASNPFLNLQMLTSNRRLRSVYIQYVGVNIVFYSLFFCIPLWLSQVKGFDPKTTGLLMLPLAGLGVIMTSVAVRCNKRFGYRTTIIAGNALLVLSTLLLLLLGDNSSILMIVLINAMLGIPNGFNNMGLQTALYVVTPAEETGAASGLYVTFRSIGSILSTSLLGLTFGGAITSSGLHTIGLITAGLSVVLFVSSLSRRLI
ncbi:Predicted arabinose efflux permease, MFS family [Paenibacillus algorifonticola]|uniref:Predicted arabinose efflux permease, MFS family n=1 Tax=Paenibacillus algorifonticola TaxID=684063 RepID=A0A1I1YU22_9BACL|nr:MFS transporter [Paenibacillus algorifonticola]SFE23094.1 Predicted arabinose efflux permease, MFS family [Paenibacillus algorifonticola]